MGSLKTEKILDLIYPDNLYCCVCGDLINSSRIHGLCDSCIEKIDWTLDDPFKFSLDEFSFSGVFTCCTYGFFPRKIIHSLKLSKETYIAKGIGKLMGERVLQEDITFDCMIAVPSGKKNLKKRGFNQAELLAEYASKECGIPLLKENLFKKSETKSMRLSSGTERRFMLSGAFEVKEPWKIKDKCILLVDDVVTTGSTAEECSRTLLENGASKVYVLCFAATSRYDIIN